MNVVMHKETGELALVHPHWEPLLIKFDEKFYCDLDSMMKEAVGNRKVVHGVLVQVGWLLQNKNDLWFGIGFSAMQAFEDLGEI